MLGSGVKDVGVVTAHGAVDLLLALVLHSEQYARQLALYTTRKVIDERALKNIGSQEGCFGMYPCKA